jgi:hypothetical protein
MEKGGRGQRGEKEPAGCKSRIAIKIKKILVSMISERNVVGCRARPYQQCCRAIAGNSALLRTISYKKDHPT